MGTQGSNPGLDSADEFREAILDIADEFRKPLLGGGHDGGDLLQVFVGHGRSSWQGGGGGGGRYLSLALHRTRRNQHYGLPGAEIVGKRRGWDIFQGVFRRDIPERQHEEQRVRVVPLLLV